MGFLGMGDLGGVDVSGLLASANTLRAQAAAVMGSSPAHGASLFAQADELERQAVLANQSNTTDAAAALRRTLAASPKAETPQAPQTPQTPTYVYQQAPSQPAYQPGSIMSSVAMQQMLAQQARGGQQYSPLPGLIDVAGERQRKVMTYAVVGIAALAVALAVWNR